MASGNRVQQANIIALFTKQVAWDDATIPASVLATIERLQRETEECIVESENWFEILECKERVEIKPIQPSDTSWSFGSAQERSALAPKPPDTASMQDLTVCAVRDFMECMLEAEDVDQISDCQQESELTSCELPPAPDVEKQMNLALGSAEFF